MSRNRNWVVNIVVKLGAPESLKVVGILMQLLFLGTLEFWHNHMHVWKYKIWNHHMEGVITSPFLCIHHSECSDMKW